MQIEDEVGDAVRGEPGDDPPDHRLAGDRDGGLRADVGQGTKPRTKTGGEHEGVSDHKATVRPADAGAMSARTKTYMVKHSNANAGKPR